MLQVKFHQLSCMESSYSIRALFDINRLCLSRSGCHPLLSIVGGPTTYMLFRASSTLSRICSPYRKRTNSQHYLPWNTIIYASISFALAGNYFLVHWSWINQCKSWIFKVLIVFAFHSFYSCASLNFYLMNPIASQLALREIKFWGLLLSVVLWFLQALWGLIGTGFKLLNWISCLS